MVVTVLVAGIAFFGAGRASADCTITTTLRVGSTGVEVSCMQSIVGATADGHFGPMTLAAVKAWQAGHGLVADGVVGPLTRAAMMGAPTGNFPAGCTSASGFSTTTGQPCNTGPSMGLPAGCSTTAGFSPLTGQPCNSGTTLPPGCTSTAGFSPTTGVSCSTGTSSGGALSGGAANVDINTTAVDTETEVKEGDSNTKVLGFKVQADGGDVSLTNVKVEFIEGNPQGTPVGTESTRLDRYAQTVSVWEGSTKIGSADVADFTKSGSTYSKSIALSNAIVREGAANKQFFYVAVTPISHIDGNDATDNTWNVAVSNIRFMDPTGVVLTDSYTDDTDFDYTSLSNSGDVKLTISRASGNPVAGNVEVSDTGSTSNVLLNQFKLKAQGSDLTFSSLDVDLTGTGATPALIASELTLIRGTSCASGSEIADISSSLGSNGTKTFTLDDDETIAQDSTVTYSVCAKVREIDTGSGNGAAFDEGDSLQADYSDIGSLEDSVGDTVTNTSGSALGEAQAFFSEGINVSNFTSSASSTVDTNGKIVSQTFTLNYDVTAFGNTYYSPKTAVRTATTAGTATQGIVYSLEDGSGSVIATGTATPSSITSSDADTVGSGFEIPDGETRSFTVTIAVTKADDATITGHGALTVPAFIRLKLASVRYDVDSAFGTLQSYTPAPVQNFETADKQLQN